MRLTKLAPLALLLGWLLASGVLPASATSLSINPLSLTVDVGQSFTLAVALDSVSDLYAFGFDLAFDPTILAATLVVDGSFLSGCCFNAGTIDNTAGTIVDITDTLSGPDPGVSGSGDLALISFQALAAGTSAITLANAILLDSNLQDILLVSTLRGTVTVGSAAIPEPGTWLLLATGSAALLGYGWRSRRIA